MLKKFQLFVIIICVFALRLPIVQRSPKIRCFSRHKKFKLFKTPFFQKKSRLQTFQTLGQEMNEKVFFNPEYQIISQ